jgi:hypothetical protein
VYLLYVDESGGDDADASSRNFVLGGISAFERVPFHLCAEVDEIIERFFPGSVASIELRASALWNGSGEPWGSMLRSRRSELMDAIYHLLAQDRKGVVLFGVVVEKSDCPTFPCVQKASEEMAGHFDLYLSALEASESEKQRGLMIFDESRHEKTVQMLMGQYRTTGASFGRVKHLAEVPLFTDSKITRMLQLADFVAYALFKRYERSDTAFLDMILPRFSSSGGRLHSLFHITSKHWECFCPPCLSRRAGARP